MLLIQKAEEERIRAWNAELNIDEWDNRLADGMLPIHKEVEAFGETMPEAKYDKEAEKENQKPDYD